MASPGIGDAVVVPGAESISSAPATVSSAQERQFYDDGQRAFQLQHTQQAMGWLGKFFGTGPAAGTNIAGVVIVVAFFLLGCTYVFSVADYGTVRAGLVTLISSALSYCFGAASNK